MSKKYKPGDRVAVFATLEEGHVPSPKENITVVRVGMDLDEDSSFKIILDGNYTSLPSDLLVVEYLGRKQIRSSYQQGSPVGKIVNE
jgi:hypothetical protein